MKSEKIASGQVLTLTDTASKQLKKLASEMKKDNYGVRVEVSPGGCAGYKYFLDFEENSSEGDLVFESHGLNLFVDPVSAQFLQGTELDYVESLTASGFQFNNPNVTHSCHCGKSVC